MEKQGRLVQYLIMPNWSAKQFRGRSGDEGLVTTGDL